MEGHVAPSLRDRRPGRLIVGVVPPPTSVVDRASVTARASNSCRPRTPSLA
jgi:hypothetical protein